jgi:hypothetical protein
MTHPFRFHVRKVIERCQQGEILCFSHRSKRTGETELVAHFEPTGHSCGLLAALEAAASGLLQPSGDTFFDDSFSQTWRARCD